jgi:hypothetical protein
MPMTARLLQESLVWTVHLFGGWVYLCPFDRLALIVLIWSNPGHKSVSVCQPDISVFLFYVVGFEISICHKTSLVACSEKTKLIKNVNMKTE